MLARGFRILAGVGLMAVLLYYANPREVARSLAGASPGWLLTAIAVVIVDRLANAYRWLVLLRAIEPARHIALGAAVRVFFVSGFIGSFLPGSVGGDAVRTLGLARLNVPPTDAFASVIVDRILGVASVLLMAAGSLVIVGDRLPAGTLALLWSLVGGLLLLFALLLFDSRLLSGMTTWLIGNRLPWLNRMLTKVLVAIRQYGHHRRTIVAVLLVSIGVQVLRTLQAWALGQAIDVDANLVWYFAFLPVIILVMLLPTSVAGLGTGALAFQVLFATVDVPAAQSFTLAVLFTATAIVGTLPGGLMLMWDRR